MSSANPNIKEIAANFHMITLPMPFRLGHVNVFLIVHDKKAIIFDTGLNIRSVLPELEASLKSVGLSIGDIGHVFLTHFHADHCGIAGLIKERSGAVIHMSEEGKRHIKMTKEQGLIIEKMREFLSCQGLPEKTLDFISKIFGHFKNVTLPFEVDEILKNGEFHRECERTFEVISTPGHANGHNCFYFREEGILLSGDHVLPDITPNLSPDLFDANFHPLEAFLSSLDRVRDLKVERVCPAHGTPFSDLKGRVDEIKEHHEERKGLVLDSIREKPKTSFQVSLDVFEEDLSEFDKFLALNETYVHIIELMVENKVREEKSGEYIVYRAS
jgi:glyoxylase-like metal-dependent hydrolase (beta-lactamase superfamily II)